jgi:uncharacterized protein (DUF2336 family)
LPVPATRSELLDELELAIQGGSAEKRLQTLRRVTDLFLGGADRFNDEQIGVFDDVLGHLIRKIEARALIELSVRLAPVDNAPIETIRQLARHDAIAVAGPVLAESARLTTADLIEIAKTKGQGHLLAISGRRELGETVTDVLLERGNREVVHSVASNSTSSLSPNGHALLVKAAENDDILAEKAGRRLDIPLHLLRELLLKATEAVRARLLALAPPDIQQEIHRTLSAVAGEVDREVSRPRDFAAARRFVELLKEKGELSEADIVKFAEADRYVELVAALSLVCSTSIDLLKPLMQSPRNEGLLVPCRAADLKWQTVSAILRMRFSPASMPQSQLDQAEQDYARLSQASAQRMLRFWQVRETSLRQGSK